jgi:hypothetical protein
MPLEYKKFRVRTPIKSFRDLDVYKNTTMLAADVFKLKLPEKYRKSEKIKTELVILFDLAKNVPRIIAESHSRKFTDLPGASAHLEDAAQLINLIIAKIDFLSVVIDDPDFRGLLLTIVNKYPTNKIKILNLKRAWNKVYPDKWGKTRRNSTPKSSSRDSNAEKVEEKNKPDEFDTPFTPIKQSETSPEKVPIIA